MPACQVPGTCKDIGTVDSFSCVHTASTEFRAAKMKHLGRILTRRFHGLPVQRTAPIYWFRQSSTAAQRSTTPVPLSRDPIDSSERRFSLRTEAEEWVETYHPGGLHPVEIGDALKEGRYVVFRKLGSGDESTVCLVYDKV
jgi:hypothetical protein